MELHSSSVSPISNFWLLHISLTSLRNWTVCKEKTYAVFHAVDIENNCR